MKIKTKHNPLSYLGWLGLLGVVGLFLRSPVLIAFLLFLLFFFFFVYRNMPVDELFRHNIRHAASRAFVISMGFNIVAVLLLIVRNMFFYPTDQPEVLVAPYTVTEYFITQSLLMNMVLVLGIAIGLCVFFFTLISIDRKEKGQLKLAAKRDAALNKENKVPEPVAEVINAGN